MKKRILIGVGVVLVALAACTGAVVFGVFSLTQPVADTGEAFLVALKDGAYDEGFELLSPALQREVKEASALKQLVERAKAQPTQWSFSSRNVSGNEGDLKGSATFMDGRQGTVSLELVKVGDAWRVNGFNLTPQ